ncbi:MAG TPA: hypothetical protein VK817_17760 [Trebonia sp.]|jgi:hypothetical protein|nr:hypothetical protein [Trebonia sp.]
MADIHGSPGDAPQMPQASSPGTAPVPYAGAAQSLEPPAYMADIGPLGDAAAAVMSGVTGLNTTESAAAHDIAAGLADAPYYPGTLAPINAMGDADAGGRDDVAGSVAGAVASATARWQEFQSDTYGQGSTIGDLMTFPPSPLDPGTVAGLTDPSGAYYDPDRDY